MSVPKNSMLKHNPAACLKDCHAGNEKFKCKNCGQEQLYTVCATEPTLVFLHRFNRFIQMEPKWNFQTTKGQTYQEGDGYSMFACIDVVSEVMCYDLLYRQWHSMGCKCAFEKWVSSPVDLTSWTKSMLLVICLYGCMFILQCDTV